MSIKRSRLGVLILSLCFASLGLAAAPSPFQGRIVVPVGNHGSTSVEWVAANQLQTRDGYGIYHETITLDTESGVLTFKSDNSYVQTEETLQPVSAGGAYFPYRRMLDRMSGDLTWIAQNLQYLGEAEQTKYQPIVSALQAYLTELLETLDANAPEAVSLLQPQPGPMASGATIYLDIETMTTEARDVLVDLFDQNWKYLGGQRLRVADGRQLTPLRWVLPEGLPAGQKGFIALKLIPAGGQWQEKLAEEIRPIFYLNSR